MNKNLTSKAGWLVLLVCLILPSVVMAETKPKWTSDKNVVALNKDRSNSSYELMNTESFGADINALRRERFTPLIEKLSERYGLDALQAKVDTLQEAEAAAGDYRITFNNNPAVFYARLVDSFESFEDNVDQTWDWTLYQLFAVSEMNVAPIFDDFEIKTKDNKKATALSLVPGLGQLYKGHNVKAYVIWGLEAGLLASTIAFEHRRNKYDNRGWDSKSRSYREMRNLAIIGMGVIYAYNLLDAAIAKGARRVVINQKDNSSISFRPAVMNEGVGLSLAWQF